MYSFLESSETIREAILVKNSDRFFGSILINQKKLSISFLNWFLGFSEGYFENISSCFFNLNCYYIFEIKKINSQILYYIKKNLSIGKVDFYEIKHFSFCRFYIVEKKYFVSIFFLLYPIYLYRYNIERLVKSSSDAPAIGWVRARGFKNNSSWWIGFLFEKMKWIVYPSQSKQRLSIPQKLTITQKYRKYLLNRTSRILKNKRLIPLERQPNGYQMVISHFFSFQQLFFFLKLAWVPYKADSRKIMVFKRWWRIFLYQIEPKSWTAKTVARVHKLSKNLNKFS
uniref:Uncharacterized protein n=1 Tax=Pseudoderbesia arbuscula TaxID=2320809 RepID=A0A386AYL9_9CHLO|nr:hypothetical protein [Pseudoderbesia arbuscula]